MASKPITTGRIGSGAKINARAFVRSTAIGLTALLGVLWYSNLSGADFFKIAGKANAWLLIPAFVVYLMLAISRAVRLRVLLPNDLRWSRVAGYSFLHNFLATLFPFRLGELSLPLLLKQEGITAARTLATLTLIRLTDLFALLICLVASLQWSLNYWPSAVQRAAPFVTGIALLGSSVILTALLNRRRWRGIPVALFRVGARRFRVFSWCLGRFSDFQDSLDTVSSASLFRVIALSMLIWVGLGVQAVLLFGGFAGVALPPMVLSCAVFLMAVLSFIPLQSLGGIGTFEVIGVISLSIAGIPNSDAAADSILVHGALLAFAAFLYPLATCCLCWSGNETNRETAITESS